MALHDYSYYERNASQSCPTPVVLVECWRADDGSVALVAANHADGEHAHAHADGALHDHADHAHS